MPVKALALNIPMVSRKVFSRQLEEQSALQQLSNVLRFALIDRSLPAAIVRIEIKTINGKDGQRFKCRVFFKAMPPGKDKRTQTLRALSALIKEHSLQIRVELVAGKKAAVCVAGNKPI